MKFKLLLLAVVLALSFTSCEKDYEIQEESNVFDTSAFKKTTNVPSVPDNSSSDPAYYAHLNPNHPFLVSEARLESGGQIFSYFSNPIYVGGLKLPSDYEWTVEFFDEGSNLISSHTTNTPAIKVFPRENTTCRFSLNAIYGSSTYAGGFLTIINQQTIVFDNSASSREVDTSSPIEVELSIDFCFTSTSSASLYMQPCDDVNYVTKDIGENGGGVTANLILP